MLVECYIMLNTCMCIDSYVRYYMTIYSMLISNNILNYRFYYLNIYIHINKMIVYSYYDDTIYFDFFKSKATL